MHLCLLTINPLIARIGLGQGRRERQALSAKQFHWSTGPGLRAGNRTVAGNRANPTSIAAAEGTLAGLIEEKDQDLKALRAAIPV